MGETSKAIIRKGSILGATGLLSTMGFAAIHDIHSGNDAERAVYCNDAYGASGVIDEAMQLCLSADTGAQVEIPGSAIYEEKFELGSSTVTLEQYSQQQYYDAAGLSLDDLEFKEVASGAGAATTAGLYMFLLSLNRRRSDFR